TLQVDRDRHRATVRTDGLAGLRTRALVVAVVDAVTVVVQVRAARRDRGRGDRGHGLRTQRHDHADRGKNVTKPVLTVITGRVIVQERADTVVVGVGAVGQLGTNLYAAHVALNTKAELAGNGAVFTL